MWCMALTECFCYLQALSEQQDLEKYEFLSQIRSLEKEISFLSSCSLAREKENLRKDLEKMKVKFKDTEFKLKNAIQEKTKLEVFMLHLDFLCAILIVYQ